MILDYKWFKLGVVFGVFLLTIPEITPKKKRERIKQQQRRRRQRRKKMVFIENKTKQADSFVHILSVFHGKIIQI